MLARRCLAIMAAFALAVASESTAGASDRSIPLPPPAPYEPLHPTPPPGSQPPAMPTPPVIYWPPPLELNPLLPVG
jgi:hypothetical protein